MSWSTSGCSAGIRFSPVKFPTDADLSTMNLVNPAPIPIGAEFVRQLADGRRIFRAQIRPSFANFRPLRSFETTS
jgi:hypothetical protein